MAQINYLGDVTAEWFDVTPEQQEEAKALLKLVGNKDCFYRINKRKQKLRYEVYASVVYGGTVSSRAKSYHEFEKSVSLINKLFEIY
jgi:hypothetical protein